MKKTTVSIIIFAVFAGLCLCLTGCTSEYSNEWLYPESVATVYVEMFENKTFRRNTEYTLTDALVKRIEAETPYKVVSNRSRADSVISGRITGINQAVLAGERETGLPLEKQVRVSASFSWKNLRTKEFLLNNTSVSATATFSEFQDQHLDYAKDVAANKLAETIVEKMQIGW